MEAGWTLANTIETSNEAQLEEIANEGGLNSLFKLLEIDEADLILIVLGDIHKVLTANSKVKQESIVYLEKGYKKQIEKLLFHPEVKIYTKANIIITIVQEIRGDTNTNFIKETVQDVLMN